LTVPAVVAWRLERLGYGPVRHVDEMIVTTPEGVLLGIVRRTREER